MGWWKSRLVDETRSDTWRTALCPARRAPTFRRLLATALPVLQQPREDLAGFATVPRARCHFCSEQCRAYGAWTRLRHMHEEVRNQDVNATYTACFLAHRP